LSWCCYIQLLLVLVLLLPPLLLRMLLLLLLSCCYRCCFFCCWCCCCYSSQHVGPVRVPHDMICSIWVTEHSCSLPSAIHCFLAMLSVLKKPASSLQAGVVAVKKPAVPLDAGVSQQANNDIDLSFLSNAGDRRAAYGRMEYHLGKCGDPEAIAAYELVKKKVAGRDAAKRQFLEDWVVDPTFAKSKYTYKTQVEAMEAEESDEEVFTRERLEHTIGKKDATDLIEQGCLEAAKDKYGRDGYKYSRSVKRRGVKRVRQAELEQEMDVNAESCSVVPVGHEISCQCPEAPQAPQQVVACHGGAVVG